MRVNSTRFSQPTPLTSTNMGGALPEPQFTEFTLSNGLRVIFHEDHSTPVVTINLLYHVGSKNEVRGKTGFAHLFEHLMFDGSKHVERGGYDHHCTSVGGDNNAFTSSDITDYHLSLPSNQLALGLWLESDRMAEFAIQEISLTTQKNVVLEEKRQCTDDAPYGSMMIHMREMAYSPEHPYSWETIGSAEDIAAVTMEDVREFYRRFYIPLDAILVIAGNFDPSEARELVEAYFGSIPKGEEIERPVASSSMLNYGVRRHLQESIIPFHAIFLAYHAPRVGDPDLCALELLSSILCDGESSRLYHAIEYTQQIASEAECFIDDGELGSLFYLYGIVQNNKVTAGELEAALCAEVARIAREGVSERELQKVKNRKMTRIVHSLQSVSNRAERLAYYAALFNDPSLAFQEADLYRSITIKDVQRVAQQYLVDAEPIVVEYEAVKRKKGSRKK